LQFQIQKRAGAPMHVQPEFTQVGDDKIISSTAWLRTDGSRQERFQVLTLRDNEIADIQGVRLTATSRALRPQALATAL
jgi:hypothetical protein